MKYTISDEWIDKKLALGKNSLFNEYFVYNDIQTFDNNNNNMDDKARYEAELKKYESYIDEDRIKLFFASEI